MNDKKGILLIILISFVIFSILVFEREVSQSIFILTGNLGAPPGSPGAEMCEDGTGPDQCSQGNEPWYCEMVGVDLGGGILAVTFELVEKCGLCGCPEDGRCNRDGGCSKLIIEEPPEVPPEEGEDETCVSDGTLFGNCSLTVPLYCNNGVLVSDCSSCGCVLGYYCSEKNVCLFDRSFSNQTDEGNSTKKEVLWEDINNKFKVSDRVSPLEILEISEGDVRYSDSNVISEKMGLKEVFEKLRISEKTMSNTDKKIKELEDKLKIPDSKELEEIFKDDKIDIIGGDIYQGMFEDLEDGLPDGKGDEPSDGKGDDPSDGKGGGDPQGSPSSDVAPELEIPCVSEINGYCNVGGLNCCENLMCTGGVCLSNANVLVAEIEGEIEEDDNYGNSLVLHDNYGFSNLIEVDVLGGGNERDVKIYKYTTYPGFIPSPDIENAVSFGVYDISLNSEAEAELSFDVLNDLLVLNQVESLAVYRYTDGHWETLDLLDAFIYSDKTRLKVKTEGFSFFSIIGQKQDLNSLNAAVGTTTGDGPLWSIYRRSYAPGVSVLEVFFGGQNKLIFGNVFDEPFIDLVING